MVWLRLVCFGVAKNAQTALLRPGDGIKCLEMHL